jgi:hypothetical protein
MGVLLPKEKASVEKFLRPCLTAELGSKRFEQRRERR